MFRQVNDPGTPAVRTEPEWFIIKLGAFLDHSQAAPLTDNRLRRAVTRLRGSRRLDFDAGGRRQGGTPAAATRQRVE
jgi:hypothetical protein